MDGSSGGGRLREVYAAAFPRLVGQLVGVSGDPAAAEDAQAKAPLLTSDYGGYSWTETPLPGSE